MTAKEVLRRLSIRPQTLYTYVSRGRISARPDPDHHGKSLYSGFDVEEIAQKPKAARRRALTCGATGAADGSAHPSSPAAAMFLRPGLEEAAQCLWGAEPGIFASPLETPPSWLGDRPTNIRDLLVRRSKIDPSLFERSRADLHREGAALIKAMADVVAGLPARPDEPIHIHLARGWRAADAAEFIRKALFCLVDKTLNSPVLEARVAAASGASLAGCLLAGVAKLAATTSGKEAGHVARRVQKAAQAGASSMGAGPMPGFSAPTAPAFDARLVELLDSFTPPAAYQDYRRLIERSTVLTPNIHFVLAALAARFDLPEDAPFLILAFARSPGWIAHALEEAVLGAPILASPSCRA